MIGGAIRRGGSFGDEGKGVFSASLGSLAVGEVEIMIQGAFVASIILLLHRGDGDRDSWEVTCVYTYSLLLFGI